jgi:hypothetical protein
MSNGTTSFLINLKWIILSTLLTIKPPTINRPAIPSPSILSQSALTVSTHQKLLKSSFKHYKSPYNNNTTFSSIWTALQIVTENNRKGRKTSSLVAAQITILRSKMG